MRAARNAVAAVFAVNGFAVASWMSRIPEVRDTLRLTPGQLGALLLAVSAGAMLGLPFAGGLTRRFGPRRIVAGGAVLAAAGMTLGGVGTGIAGSAWVTAMGLFAVGFGTGVWDVAMNVEAAAIEHVAGQTIMPRFHAAFSLGTVAGAAVGAAAAATGSSLTGHLVGAAIVVAALPGYAVRAFLPAAADPAPSSVERRPWHAWTELRTLWIGLLVLAMALTEGTANDWLAVALVDGYHVPHWVGVLGFTIFLTAMTAGRTAGTVLLDRFGRTRVLWATMAAAGLGVLAVVFGGRLPLVFAGAVAWGLGASLGFPVGMSAAADEPAHAAARVSVVSTIGYTAFLAGPPFLGYLGDHLGTRYAVLVVAVLLVPASAVVRATRPPVEVRTPPAARSSADASA